MDIREFIAARLDERQARAEAAIRATLEADAPNGQPDWVATDDSVITAMLGHPVATGAYGMPAEIAEFIADHDPARVLRDVAARRTALKRHARCGSGLGWCDDGGHSIPTEFGGCFDLRELALVDEGHADFSPLWKRDDWEA